MTRRLIMLSILCAGIASGCKAPGPESDDQTKVPGPSAERPASASPIAPASSASPLDLGQQPQSWQADWRAFAKEYNSQCKLAEQSGRSIQDVSQLFKGKVVEWTGVLKGKTPPSSGGAAQVAMTMDQMHFEFITGGASTDVGEITLAPIGEEWALWATAKEGSQVTFRCKIEEIQPKMFTESVASKGDTSFTNHSVVILGLRTMRGALISTSNGPSRSPG